MDKPILPPDMAVYEKVQLACRYILDKGNKKTYDDTFSSNELFEKAKNEFPLEFPITFSKNTFYQYLSNSVKDTMSAINCKGKKQGYYLSSIAEEVILNEDENKESPNSDFGTTDTFKSDSTATSTRNLKEILLYPMLESWLIAQGCQAKDVSFGRSLGKWGNPDIAGITAIDDFNGSFIELVTIEAKVSLDNWEQWIFEAVSHRRFANRAYFAFAHPEETISKIPQDMRYYAEIYNIGVLVLSLENEKFKQLQAGTLTRALESDDVEVIEVFSAPYNFVQPKYQIQFCKALGISNLRELFRWGKSAE